MHTTLILHAFERRLRDSRVPATHQARVYTILREAIADLRNKTKASRISSSSHAQKMLAAIAQAAEVTPDQVRTDTKGAGLQARLLAMYLFRERRFSFAEIGHYFERDHTTVIRSVKVVKQRLALGDEITTELYNKYKELI